MKFKIQLTSLWLRAWIRNFVSVAVGGGVAYVAQHYVAHFASGYVIPVTIAATAIYNGIVQKIETKWPWTSFFLGALPQPKSASVSPAPEPASASSSGA